VQIFYNNEAIKTTTTISALTENPYYLLDTGLKDSRLSRVGRTIDDAAQWIKFDLGSAASVTNIIINNHNLTAGATVVLEGNATDVWTSPTVSETLTVADVIYKAFTGASLQYWRITLDDASNPDAYLEVGSVFLGTALTLPGFNPDGSLFTTSSSSKSLSLTRQMYAQRRQAFKIAEISFPAFSTSDCTAIKTWLDTVDVVDPFYVLIWENEPTKQPPVYMALDEYPAITKRDADGESYSMKIKLGEVF